MSIAPPNADASAPSSSQGMRGRLRDAEINLGQNTAQIVACQDATLKLAMGALFPQQVDVDPSDLKTPTFRLPELLDDGSSAALDSANVASVNRLESALLDYGIQGLDDATGQNAIGRANPIGFKRVHDLQVVWLGSSREWLVLEGGIRWREYDDVTGAQVQHEQVFSRQRLNGRKGWIVMRTRVSPLPYDSRVTYFVGTNGYTLIPVSIEIQDSPTNSPPLRSLASALIDPDVPNVFYNTVTWEEGIVLLPIAYVEPPDDQHIAPAIRQCVTGSWNVSALDTPAIWNGTWPRSTFTRVAPP